MRTHAKRAGMQALGGTVREVERPPRGQRVGEGGITTLRRTGVLGGRGIGGVSTLPGSGFGQLRCVTGWGQHSVMEKSMCGYLTSTYATIYIHHMPQLLSSCRDCSLPWTSWMCCSSRCSTLPVASAAL